jgi:phosphinothricin acetyltransferase
MELRLAQWTDLKSINKIYNQAVEEMFCTAHLHPVTMRQRESWFESHDPERFPVYVIAEQGNVTGWMSLTPYRTDRQALSHVAEVSYYVDRHHRRKGLGRLLVNQAIAVAPSYGFSVLIAILLSRNPASIGLLEKSGFSRWGTMPGIALIGDQVADHLYYGFKF